MRGGTRREPNGQGDSRWAAPPQWDDRSRGRWFGRVAPCDCHSAWYTNDMCRLRARTVETVTDQTLEVGPRVVLPILSVLVDEER